MAEGINKCSHKKKWSSVGNSFTWKYEGKVLKKVGLKTGVVSFSSEWSFIRGCTVLLPKLLLICNGPGTCWHLFSWGDQTIVPKETQLQLSCSQAYQTLQQTQSKEASRSYQQECVETKYTHTSHYHNICSADLWDMV